MNILNDNQKRTALAAFWGTFGILIITVVMGIMSFTSKLSKNEIEIQVLKAQAIEAKGERIKLDESQDQVLQNQVLIKNNQEHQKQMLEYIKSKI